MNSFVEYEAVSYSAAQSEMWAEGRNCSCSREIMIMFKMKIKKLFLTFHFSGPSLSLPVKTKGQVPQLVLFSSPTELITLEYISLQALGCSFNLYLSSQVRCSETEQGNNTLYTCVRRFCIIIHTAVSVCKYTEH